MGRAFEAVLYLLPSSKTNQRLMLAGLKMDVPFGNGDVSGVKRALQHIDGELQAHFPALVFRHGGKAFQKALYFRWGLEAPGSKALKGLLDNGGIWLVRTNNFSAALVLDIFVAKHGRENIISRFNTGAHFLDNLAAVLLALKLSLSGEHRLNKFTLGRVFKSEIEAFNACAAQFEGMAQFKMKLTVPRNAFEIIEDHHIIAVRICIEIF